MLIEYDKGIKIKDLDVSIDPITLREASSLNIFTHAHRDHINLTKKMKTLTSVLSKPTKNIAEVYFSKFKNIILEKKKTINNVEIEFKNSGHVFGSKLINIYLDKKYTFTGDINTRDTFLTKAIEPEPTDVLFIESTYGLENNVFPDYADTAKSFLNWLKISLINNRFPIVLAYSFGKTQEIIAMVNSELNINIGLMEPAYSITKVHKSLKNYFKVNGNLKEMDMLILPPSLLNRDLIFALEYNTKKSLAITNVSGHDLKNNFKISNHADCKGLLEFVEQSEPKKVYTYHGHSEEFAKIIRKKLKIDAEPLQKGLNDIL